jgi:hypothetical protein
VVVVVVLLVSDKVDDLSGAAALATILDSIGGQGEVELGRGAGWE